MRFDLPNPRARKKQTNRLASHRAELAERAAKDAAETERVLQAFEDEFARDGPERGAVAFVRAETASGDGRDVAIDRTRADDVGRAREGEGKALARAAESTRERDGGAKRVRVIDAMLEEFVAKDALGARREQAVSGERAEASGGGMEVVDTRRSTNVRVSGLPSDVGELDLAQAFERFGSIASVKIWRPRDGAQDWAVNSGYVCFMCATSAERATTEWGETTLFGAVVQVEMAKPMRLPEQPVWPTMMSLSAAAEILEQTSADALRESVQAQPPVESAVSGHADVVVRIPDDPELRRRIDITAAYVAEDGESFERALKAREASNDEFQFLFDGSDIGAYYAWRVFAFCQGDGWTSWRTEPFIMFRDGARWIPPPMESDVPAPDAPGTSASRRGGVKLSPADRTSLSEILENVSASREDIRDAMEFAVERAECSADVADTITASLLDMNVGRRTKIAQLYVVSDILHNCSAPVRGVQAYRAQFNRTLPAVFEHLGRYARGIVSSMSRTNFKRDVLRVVGAWDDWCLFAEDFISALRVAFDGDATI